VSSIYILKIQFKKTLNKLSISHTK